MAVLLPNEILVNIIQHLPLYSQRQCLQVCRSWNSVARTFTDDEGQLVSLYTSDCVRSLLEKVSLDPFEGMSIRRIHFDLHHRINHYIIPSVFVALTKACPNLAEIVFVNASSHKCIDLLLNDAVDLPKLEAVRFPGYRESNHRPAGYLTDLSLKYCKTITQACIRLSAYKIHGYSDVAGYLQQFKTLKHLSLEVYCPVEFDLLIKACCKLQVLDLKVIGASNFRVMETVDNRRTIGEVGASPTIIQLETLKIDQDLLTQDLCDYLKRYCPYLSRLEVCIGPDQVLNPVVYPSVVSNEAQVLAITSMAIDGDLVVTNRLTTGLHKWFPLVRQLDINCFDVEAATNNHYNCHVEFSRMDLSYISLDISNLFKLSRTPFARVALKIITTGNITTWYQREGKWRTANQFILKHSNQFTNASATQRRMLSDTTAVVSIKASSIQYVRVHFHIHKNSFSQ
ncbi:hypothetical protein MBANPS3_001588, partial [Mucor bainieri]